MFSSVLSVTRVRAASWTPQTRRGFVVQSFLQFPLTNSVYLLTRMSRGTISRSTRTPLQLSVCLCLVLCTFKLLCAELFTSIVSTMFINAFLKPSRMAFFLWRRIWHAGLVVAEFGDSKATSAIFGVIGFFYALPSTRDETFIPA
jgi:hypothetical protein